MKLAHYLHQRFRTLYAGSRATTYHEVEGAAEARGYQVHEVPNLGERGRCFCGDSGFHICLRRRGDVAGGGHEMCHAWMEDNFQYGIEYPAFEWGAGTLEQAAQAFECLVVEGD